MNASLPLKHFGNPNLKLIEDPALLLKRFCEGYRELEPLVTISEATSRRIDRVIADLVAGKNVDAIQEQPHLPFHSEAGPSKCCGHFLGYMEHLREHMTAPRVFSISHERALMLLYDYTANLSFDQPFLLLEGGPLGERYLVSTSAFEAKFKRRAVVRITVETNSDDPTIFDRGWADQRAAYLLKQ